MIKSEKDAGLPTWSAPQCPFTIEYSPRTLDNIRLAVMDAFFSLPRGGAEIGGILFGHWDGERLAIEDFTPLDCEHAFGPSFALSPRDRARLADLLAAPGPYGLQAVGWYHSHTRSEILLSDADQEIHRSFFPEPWQVALILKPDTFHPTRAGFFFHGTDGGIHAEASYNEFVLAPLKAMATTAREPAPAAIPVPMPRSGSRQEVPAAPVAEPERSAVPPILPTFLHPLKPRSKRWLRVALALLAGFGLGAAAYLMRDLWLPPVMARAQRPPVPAPLPPLGLNTIDSEGQLQIRWNRDSAAVQQASGGVLSINAGGALPQEIALDKAHLLSGVLTFARQTERVDVSLGLIWPDGPVVSEATTFMGKLPERKSVEDQATQEQSDVLAKQMAKVQADLNLMVERDTNLKKSVDLLGKQLREQQRSRSRKSGTSNRGR